MMMDGNLLVTILRISILKITATLDLVVCDSVHITVGIYVAIIHEKVFLGSDGTFSIDFLQGIHLCKNFCNPTMAF